VAAIGVVCLTGDEAGVADPFCASGVLEGFATGEGKGDWAGVATGFCSGVADEASDSPGFEPTLSLVTGVPPLAPLLLAFPEVELGFSEGLASEARVVEFLFVAPDEPFLVLVWLAASFGDVDLVFDSVPESGRIETRAPGELDSRSPGNVKMMSSLFPRCST
jgi:hypothetical protein